MRSIVDYIKNHGSSDLTSLPLNEVDSLILCQLSYLKFDKVLPPPDDNSPGVVLKDLSEHPDLDTLFEDKRYGKKNRALFEAAVSSDRFAKMRLGNYVSITDPDYEVQFSAVTFLFENGLFYVAFRGTDETLIGWKEDCNMALLSPIPSQEKAVAYLNRIGRITHGDFLIGGHSKGGNLAVYAASNCQPDISERILSIYNHDGPGFPQGTLMETEGYKKIRPRIRKYIPHSSLVGMLMESHEPYEVVECRKFGILQHDPYNWIVDKTAFKRAGSLYEHAVVQDDSINRWICEMMPDERKVFVDSLFDVLTASGAKTLPDIMSDWRANSKAMKEAIENVDPTSREILQKILSNLFDILQEEMRLKVEERFKPGFGKRKDTQNIRS